MLDLTLSKEQQEILAKFLDDKDRDAIFISGLRNGAWVHCKRA
ncbi:hypothetical protein [Nitrosomonas ureae]|nr:hypothetical protein [Nitrosomonas ureae]